MRYVSFICLACSCALSFTQEQLHYDSNGNIRLYSTEHTESAFSRFEAIRMNESELVSKKYDKLWRVTKEIVWNTAGTDISEITVYFYDDEKTQPVKKEVTKGNILYETVFSEKGVILTESVFLLQQPEAHNSAQERDKKTLSERTVYTYADDGEIIKKQHLVDEILIMETLYETAHQWSEKRFFDGGFALISFFKDGVKTREEYTENDRIIRIREFIP